MHDSFPQLFHQLVAGGIKSFLLAHYSNLLANFLLQLFSRILQDPNATKLHSANHFDHFRFWPYIATNHTDYMYLQMSYRHVTNNHIQYILKFFLYNLKLI